MEAVKEHFVEPVNEFLQIFTTNRNNLRYLNSKVGVTMLQMILTDGMENTLG